MVKDIKIGKGNKKDMSMQMDMEQNELELKSITLGEFSKVWFYEEYSRRVRPATVRMNQYHLEKHVLPHFNDKFLHEISATDIEKFYAKKRERYSERTLYGIVSFLSALFRAAVEKGILNEQPMRGMIKMIKMPKQTFVPWSNDEITRLFKVAESEGDGVVYEFVLATGVRLGELLALSWNDFDFDKQTVTIIRNVSSFGNGKEQIEQIRSGYRTITLPPDLLPKLQKHKEGQLVLKNQFGEQYCDYNLVFPKKNGEIQNFSTVRARFDRLIEKANVKRMTFHDLRKMHTYLIINSGISPDMVKKRLGYKNIDIDMMNNFLTPQLKYSMFSIHPFKGMEKK